MSLLLSAFCIVAGLERWCNRQAQFLTETPIAAVFHTYCFCVRRRCDTPVFRAYAGTVRDANDRPRSILFDTDSYRICIDTFASVCMSPDKDHFISYKASKGQECKDISAGLKIEGRGILKFRIDNDDGITHTINVPNSFHIPYLPIFLVSPQHWAQQTSDGNKSTSGANSTILTFQE